MAFWMEQASTCQLCGTAEWEWNENRHAYAPVEKFCHGCYLKSIASGDGGTMPGTTIELQAVTPLVRAKEQVHRQKLAKMDMGDDEA